MEIKKSKSIDDIAKAGKVLLILTTLWGGAHGAKAIANYLAPDNSDVDTQQTERVYESVSSSNGMYYNK